MSEHGKAEIADIIATAPEVNESSDRADEGKPKLLVEHVDPHRTVAALCAILAKTDQVFDRGVLVRLVFDQVQKGMTAQKISTDGLVMLAHSICRPYENKTQDGQRLAVDCRLPVSIAKMCLDGQGQWGVPALNGIASTPLLRPDGSIHSKPGHDLETGLWLEQVPEVGPLMPQTPSEADALNALRKLRETFATFCFGDALTTRIPDVEVPLIDTDRPPGYDESAFLVALLTAVSRPSLYRAPGVLIRAASMSGAGSGKGLLARCICAIANGREPSAVTSGGSAEELEKRIAAELIAGGPVLFLDNINRSFKSDLLASAITERPARIRILGKTKMVPLNAAALVILTGNGLSVSEDLARRFIAIELDPRTEEPEARSFAADILADVKLRRPELLAAALTIWRWGRSQDDLPRGRTFGSFEQWGQWVRDPLCALGCCDPVARAIEAKQRDPGRQIVVDAFRLWWDRHENHPVALSALQDDVVKALDPQARGRQYLSAQLGKLTGTRMAGFALTRQASPGKWGQATYALERSDEGEPHRGHGGHEQVGFEDRPSAQCKLDDDA